MPSVAMDGREIPGFYYDAAKKKYFKIQPNHLASTASQYSRQNVSKARKEAAQVEVENRRKYAESVQRVRRSALVTSQSGLFARRELGRAPNNVLDFEARAIGAGYNNAECIVGGLYPVAALARLPQTDQYVLGASARIYMLGPRQDRAKQFTVSSRITSMSVSDDYMVVTGSAGGMNPASIHFYSENDCQHELSTMPHAIIGAQDDVSHFSSAGNPVAHNSMFLIGSTAGAALVSPEPPDNINPSIHTGSDVLAVDWVNASIAVLGTRNGSIHLWDTRAQGSALRLHHGSCISKLRQLDQNLLVVAGLEHSLAMYDLRMPAIQHLPSRKNKRQHNGSSKKTYTSTPILRYPYSNQHTLNLGLYATRSAGGLLCTGDDQGYVNIFSLNYDSLLRRFRPTLNREQLTRNLVFEEDEAVLVGTSGGVFWRAEWGGGAGTGRG